MRVALIVSTIAVMAAIAALATGCSVQVGPVLSVCSRDDEIPQSDRADIVGSAQAFVALIQTGSAEAARGAMSSDARTQTELQAIEAAQHEARSFMAGEVSVGHVYRVSAPLGSRNGMSLCGSPSHPDLVARHGGANVALVLFDEPTNGSARTWTVYLEREADEWRVRHFQLSLSAVSGHDGAAFSRMADEQEQAGHTFNATLLRDLARLLLSRGESFQSAAFNELMAMRSSELRHPDIAGVAPYAFHLGEGSFAVSRVTISGTGDQKLVLLLDQPSDTPVSVAEAIQRNHLLIDAMNAERPEWREAFDAVVASYPTGPNNSWRTVYSRDTGYVSEPDAEEETP